ncbi:MAG: ABC transporter ATP-binding protein [Gemmataceae bacterium]|nr:ABC transporter ATP-binding protein [Gemmataceae bacterium]
MTAIALERVRKVFPGGARALDGLDLHIRSREVLALVGPSGCGKTTTLRLIAGLETPTAGVVRLEGRDAAGLAPSRRGVAMVFQRPALYPHLTVRRNLTFPVGPDPAANSGPTVAEVAQLLGLDDLLERVPAQLSGGQQQRVALGRALLRRPAILLLDEPLASLDAPLRTELRRELHLLHRRFPTTMVYVTHDPLEALALADRVAVLARGTVQQLAEPETICSHPANRFVAGFFRWAPVNFFDGRLVTQGERLALLTDDGRLCLCGLPAGWAAHAGQAVTVGLRAEDIEVGPDEPTTPAADAWEMQAVLVERTARGYLVGLTSCDGNRAPARIEGFHRPAGQVRIEEGRKVAVRCRLDRAHLFDRTTGRRLGD